jgi:hypothetical protein
VTLARVHALALALALARRALETENLDTSTRDRTRSHDPSFRYTKQMGKIDPVYAL